MKMGEKFVNFADFEDNDELTNCRRLAKEIVKNVIDKAREEVAKQVQFEIKSTKITGKRPASLQLNNLTPSIQIDLVPSRTPTPEEDNHVWIEQQQQTNKKKRKIRVKIIEEEDENQLAEEEKASKESNLKKKQEEINQNENKKSNSTTKKKSSVSWGSDDNETQDKKQKIEHNSKNSIKNIEQINDNQFSNDEKKKTNSIKFNSSNENKLINNKNEKLPNNIDKRSCKFTEEVNSIDWPNYNDQEINKVASNFVQQLMEDAKKEAEKRLKPSPSRTSALYIEDKSNKTNSPWSLGRIREILSRLMRSTCLCKKSSVITQSNTYESIAEHV